MKKFSSVMMSMMYMCSMCMRCRTENVMSFH